jgi:hypothetical protein
MIAALTALLAGCSHLSASRAGSPPPPPARTLSPDEAETVRLRNNAAGLLYNLLNDEKNVGKIFVLKHATPEVVGLIKQIAATADANQKIMEQMSRSDSGLDLKAVELPPGERAARAAEAKSEEYDLLFSSGGNFEFNLLLTQAEAQNYGWHLAKVAAEHSSAPEDARRFTAMSEAMKGLYEQTVTQMRSLPAH